jgi:pimeloyl-ACP methyl ester carboxylesterase
MSVIVAEVQTVVAGGLEFGYLEDGPRDGPLALCLHGFPDSAHTWRYLLPKLAGRGYHAVAPFMRGYAPTAIPADGAYQTGALSADANALHEALGGGADAVVIGHDWGGAAVYGAVGREPQRWRRAVAMAVPPLPAMVTAFFEYEQLKRSFYVFLFQTPLAEAVLNESLVAGLWRDWSLRADSAADVAHVMACLDTPQRRLAAIGYYRAMLDSSRNLPAYDAEQDAAFAVGTRPVLYLHGRRDNALGVDIVGDPLPHLAVGSRYVVVDDAGHFLHLDRPAEVDGLVLDWLES